jgi:hypothetical protein
MTRFETYQAVRKLNPDLYWSSKTQKQMHDEAKKMGNAFYKQEELDFMVVQNDTHHR